MTDIVPLGVLRPNGPIPTIDDCKIEMLSDGGGYRISWQMPAGLHGRRAQVYGRKVTTPVRTSAVPVPAAEPFLLGVGTGYLDVPGLTEDIEILIVPEMGEQGVFAGPQHTTRIQCKAPEFRRIGSLANVQGFMVETDGTGFSFCWSPVPSPELTHYEIRRGTRWEQARVVARTTGTSARYDYPPSGLHSFMIRAFFGPGMPSPYVTQADAVQWITAETKGVIADEQTEILATINDKPLLSSLTLSTGLELSGSVVRIKDGYYSGTATYATGTSMAATPLRWAVDWNVYQTEPGEVLGEEGNRWESLILGTPEAQFTDLNERRPSWRRPGVDLDTSFADLDDMGWCNYVLGKTGNLGHWTRCTVDIRYRTDTTPTWTAWRKYQPNITHGDGAEIRFTLERATFRQQLNLESLAVSAFAAGV